MSQRNSADKRGGEYVQKQQLNVYTVMLIVAFLAITTASLLLYLELRRWGEGFPWWKADVGISTSYLAPTDTPEARLADCVSPAPSYWV